MVMKLVVTCFQYTNERDLYIDISVVCEKFHEDFYKVGHRPLTSRMSVTVL